MKRKEESGSSATTRNRSIVWSAVGIALIVLSVYVLSAPGRIDIIDGQLRYEVASNILHQGRPILSDPVITALKMSGVPGNGGYLYSFYCAAGSVFAVPLIWIGGLIGSNNGEAQRFLFSFTSAIFGASTAVVLYVFYIDLGISRKRAFWWTLISAFATMMWPASTSTFDNAQHSFFALLAVFLAYRSSSRKSRSLAVAAGLIAGILINYQEYFVILMPTLAIATLCWQPFLQRSSESDNKSENVNPAGSFSFTDRFFSVFTTVKSLLNGHGKEAESRQRYLLFILASWSGLVLFCIYNYVRFGLPQVREIGTNWRWASIISRQFFRRTNGVITQPWKKHILIQPCNHPGDNRNQASLACRASTWMVDHNIKSRFVGISCKYSIFWWRLVLGAKVFGRSAAIMVFSISILADR